jgi:CRISPR-associated protein Cmr5
MANTSQTLQQERAASAWAQIEQVELENDKFKKEYGSLVRGLPAMILSDGLAQTLAFLLAKGKDDRTKPHYVAYQHLSSWVCRRLETDKDLLDWVLHKSSADYRRAASESLAYLHWLKRFVEAKDWRSDEE